jgi:hypothetical protein
LLNNVPAYDAVYIALAEALGAVLLTRDHRLAGAAGHRAVGVNASFKAKHKSRDKHGVMRHRVGWRATTDDDEHYVYAIDLRLGNDEAA